MVKQDMIIDDDITFKEGIEDIMDLNQIWKNLKKILKILIMMI